MYSNQPDFVNIQKNESSNNQAYAKLDTSLRSSLISRLNYFSDVVNGEQLSDQQKNDVIEENRRLIIILNCLPVLFDDADQHRSSPKIADARTSTVDPNDYRSPKNIEAHTTAQESIYIVTENFESNHVFDLSASKDDTVTVIKRMDPTDDSRRWFVDNGKAKGFLPASILSPKYSQAKSFQLSSPSSNIYEEIVYEPLTSLVNVNTAPSHTNVTDQRRDLTELAFEYLDGVQQRKARTAQLENRLLDLDLHRQDPPVNEHYRAAFAFNCDGEKQLPLLLGDIVIVKHKKDLSDNDEWWYVEKVSSKQCGYVPSAYLTTHP